MKYILRLLENVEQPTIYFHGSLKRNLTSLKVNADGIIYLSPRIEEARLFSSPYTKDKGSIYRVLVSPCQIFDGFNLEHLEKIGEDPDSKDELRLWDSSYVEDWHIQEGIKKAGFDGFYVRDYPIDYKDFYRNIGVYNPNKLKIIEEIK